MKIMNGSDSGMNDFLLSRTLPLVNHTAVWLYTVNDFFKPGPQNVLQSTLPFYELTIIILAFIWWIVLLIYFWKMIYYVVDDTYATPYGSAPPYEWRKLDTSTTAKILNYIQDFANSLNASMEK